MADRLQVYIVPFAPTPWVPSALAAQNAPGETVGNPLLEGVGVGEGEGVEVGVGEDVGVALGAGDGL